MMGNAKYIGRVGALAVALGVGIAVASSPGVALAEPADSITSSSPDAPSSSSLRHSGATSTDTSAPSSSTSTDLGHHRGPLNAPGQMALSSSGGLTSSPTASTPAGPAPAGEVGRMRSGAPGVVVARGGPHSSSLTVSSAAAATTPADTEPTSTSSTAPTSTAATPEAPSSDTLHTVGADSSPRSGTTALIGRRQPHTAAPAVGSPLPRTAQPPGAATAPATGTTAPASSPDVAPVVVDVARPLALTTPPDLPTATVAASAAMSFTAVAATTAAPAVASPTPADVVSGIVSTLVSGVPSPFAGNAPTTPVEPPTLWTLLAFVRREFERAFFDQPPTVDPLAGQVTSGLVTATPTLYSPSLDPAITDETSPTVGAAKLIANAQPDATAAPATFTGQPSLVSQVLSAVFRIVGVVGEFLGVDLTIPVTGLLQSDRPPWFTTLGLNVQRSEFEGMPVWALQSPGSSSEETVVAVHGGGLVLQPVIFNWLAYARMARDTGATVIVPIYPLVPQGGTAGTVVPAMADLISAQIDQHGAENVSVFGDSAGGNIALAAVQEMVRRGDPVPSRMVLSSPPLDATLSNPAIQFVDDPVLSGTPTLSAVLKTSRLWADGLDLTDPLVSPLYGSLAGLPPTAVYAGSNDVVAPDVLILREEALATPGADFTFILRKGEPHDWAILTILPETQAILPDIYQQLGIA